MTKRILGFYNRILTVGSLVSDVEGKVSAMLEGASRPFTINGKRVMLPTPDVQAMSPAEKEHIEVFHPLQENVLRDEAKVMEKFRDAVNLSANIRLVKLLGHIIQLAASPGQHQLLKTEHFSLMGVLKDADAETFERWEKVRKAMPWGDNEHCVVHIFIKKNAEIAGRSYRRGAIVSFPLYEEIVRAGGDENTKGDLTVWGVKLRKKDHAAFKALLEAIFPGIQEKNCYSRGGPSVIAPSLDALLRAIKDIAGQVNTVVETFEDVIEVSDLRYDDEWVEEADNIDSFEADRRLLPMQKGNEGGTETSAQPAQPAAAAAGTIPVGQVLPSNQPYAAVATPSQVQPAAPSSAGTVSMQEILGAQPALAAMGGMMMPGMPNYGYPGMGMYQMPTGTAALRSQAPTWMNPIAQFQNRGF